MSEYRRYVKSHRGPAAGSALVRPEAHYWLMDPSKPRWLDVGELETYRRNIETIIDLALLRGIKPILTTQPYSRNADALYAVNAEHIDQCNEIVREIAAKFGYKIAFVDLDALMVGQFDHVFLDVAHVSEKGRIYKAKEIAEKIIDHSRPIQRLPWDLFN